MQTQTYCILLFLIAGSWTVATVTAQDAAPTTMTTTIGGFESTTAKERLEPTTTGSIGLCKRIRISGTMDQEAREGSYVLRTIDGCRGKPVWEHDNGGTTHFLYATDIEDVDYWVVGPSYCSDTVGMHSVPHRVDSPLEVPSGGWKELLNSDWVESTLSMTCEEKPEESDSPDWTTPSKTDLCKSIWIRGTSYQRGVEGVYRLKSEEACTAGRPSWVNSDNNYFLYMWRSDDGDIWIVGPYSCSNIGNIRSATRSWAYSPLQVSDGGWQEHKGSKQWITSTLSMSCLDDGPTAPPKTTSSNPSGAGGPIMSASSGVLVSILIVLRTLGILEQLI